MCGDESFGGYRRQLGGLRQLRARVASRGDVSRDRTMGVINSKRVTPHGGESTAKADGR
jgi:hypothetical protein